MYHIHSLLAPFSSGYQSIFSHKTSRIIIIKLSYRNKRALELILQSFRPAQWPCMNHLNKLILSYDVTLPVKAVLTFSGYGDINNSVIQIKDNRKKKWAWPSERIVQSLCSLIVTLAKRSFALFCHHVLLYFS